VKSKATKSLYPFILLVALSSIYEIVFIYFLKFDSDYWSKIYLFLEFVTLVFVFNKNSDKSFRFVSYFFCILFFCSYFYFKIIKTDIPTLKTDGILSIIEFFYVVFFSIYWFISVFNKREAASLLQLPFFYFVSGLVIYFSGTIFLFLLSEELLKEGLSLNQYWVVNVVLLLFFRVLLLVAIWMGRNT